MLLCAPGCHELQGMAGDRGSVTGGGSWREGLHPDLCFSTHQPQHNERSRSFHFSGKGSECPTDRQIGKSVWCPKCHTRRERHSVLGTSVLQPGTSKLCCDERPANTSGFVTTESRWHGPCLKVHDPLKMEGPRSACGLHQSKPGDGSAHGLPFPDPHADWPLNTSDARTHFHR